MIILIQSIGKNSVAYFDYKVVGPGEGGLPSKAVSTLSGKSSVAPSLKDLKFLAKLFNLIQFNSIQGEGSLVSMNHGVAIFAIYPLFTFFSSC